MSGPGTQDIVDAEEEGAVEYNGEEEQEQTPHLHLAAHCFREKVKLTTTRNNLIPLLGAVSRDQCMENVSFLK
jgi:hypothetical protein